MENMLPIIPAWVMLTIGMALLGIELLIGSFVVMFFGIAFILVGGAGFFFEWSSGEIQLLVTVLLGGILTFALRGLLMKGMDKEDLPLETMQTGDSGEVVNHGGELRVMYKGTTWTFKNLESSELSAGEEVIVESLKNNVAYVKKQT
ncbi:MAG: NfeD family protein [Pseudomonadota bacterium]|nr:NfeD family protein [Pseudomonadota bacterium]